MTYTIEVGYPPKAVWSNHRARHWAVRSTAVAKQRRSAEMATLAVLGTARPRLQTARISVYLRSYNRNGAGRLPDPDNVNAAMKGAVDGLVDAGLLADDRNLRWESPNIERVKDRLAAGATITVEALA